MAIRRTWTIQEDKVLKILKQDRNIKKWSSIARIMDFQFNMCGRNGKQCRQRYNNHLHQGILEKKLTHEQEKQLQRLNNQIGNKWSVIAKYFQGRTANFLKNQLYSKLRKSIRKLNKFMKEMKIKPNKPFKLNIVYKIVQSNDFKIFQKQRHSEDDLRFYEEIKGKLFKYADQPLLINKQNDQQNAQIIAQSQYLTQNLNMFSVKYENFNQKTKKPRKKYFCEDDIILNSLSNNRPLNLISYQQKSQQMLCQLSQQECRSDDDQDSQSIQTSDKKPTRKRQHQTMKFQLKLYDSKHFDNYKQKDLYDNPFQNTRKFQNNIKLEHNQKNNQKTIKDIQRMANQNVKIVQQGQLQQFNGGCRLLEQSSQQCHMIDIQYLEHIKSCSLIDQSLFQ